MLWLLEIPVIGLNLTVHSIRDPVVWFPDMQVISPSSPRLESIPPYPVFHSLQPIQRRGVKNLHTADITQVGRSVE